MTPSTQTPQLLVRRSTNVIELREFFDELTDTFPTDATIVCTIRDSVGTPVAGATSLPMTYVAGTSRYETTYRAVVPNTVDLSGANYSARITATLTGAVREFNVPCTAVDG